MKVEAGCILCIVQRALAEVKRATNDPKLQFKAMKKILDFLCKELDENAVPAVLGTKRDRLIREITGNPDPYKEIKKESNYRMLSLLPEIRKLVLDEPTECLRFRKACLCAVVGNILEFDIPEHQIKFEDVKSMILSAEKHLAIDHIKRVYDIVKSSDLVLYLMDNAGEIVLDTVFIEQIKALGVKVVAVVKESPVLNDATMEDAIQVGLDKIADKVITTGSDAVGLLIDECSEELMEYYRKADLVIAKGMGNFETLTEKRLKKPHVFLLHTKCSTVANFLKVDMKRNVVLIME